MRNIIILILFIFTFSFSKGYSLNELIDSAYKHSHLLAIADMQIEKNIDAIDEAKRNMVPKITFSGNYSYAITPYNSMADILSGEFPSFTQTYKQYLPGPGSFKIGDTLITYMLDYLFLDKGQFPRNSLSGGIDLRQTIWAQNKLRHAVEYAKIQGSALICSWQDVRMRVKSEMTRLYCSALLAGEQSRIEEQSRSIAQNRHNHTLSLFNSQIVGEIDTLNSFVDFSQASVRLAESRRGEAEIYRSIAVAAGLKEPADSIILTDTISRYLNRFDYDTLLTYFLAENKTLRLLVNEVDLAEMRVKMAKDDYYPVVFGGLMFNRISYFDEFGDFNFAPERKAYLGLTYDITPFGQRRLRVKRSEYDLQIAKKNLEHQKEQLILLLKSNYDMINEEYTKIEESKRILDAAEKALLIAQNRYENGQISQTDIDISEQRFRKSGLSYLSSIFRYNSLLIDLRIMGADYLYEPLKSIENERIAPFE